MGISVWQLLILLAVVLLIFGTKKLKNVGGDLGSAIKNFKSSVKDDNHNPETATKIKTDIKESKASNTAEI